MNGLKATHNRISGMRELRLFILLIFSIPSGHIQGQDISGHPGRISRGESFFGIHFDLHAGENMENLGSGLNDVLIDSFLLLVKPDFIQVDSKGHSGISSYPTKIGFQAKSYFADPMMLWREVTARNNVALYAHFSGIFDRKVVSEFPEWAVKGPSGTPSKMICSTYSPYSDSYMIPQLKELASTYQLDGVWVDGECWAIEPDYSLDAKQEFGSTTGISTIPKTMTDPGFPEFMTFQRDLFKRHVKHYISEVHKEYPDFQITSNWAFSSMMPEEVSIDLDFLSGDLTPGNAVYRAAFESRCLAPQGKHWDIMAWSFSWDPGGHLPRNTKSASQINQELSEVMAMGGGVQVYFRQLSDLSFLPWNIDIMKDVSDFCRVREKYCFHNESVPDVALLYSGFSYKHQISDIYPEWDPSLFSLQGTLNILLDNQLSVEILQEHHLIGKLSDYKLLIIPNWDTLEVEFQKEIINYVKNGGKLILSGENPVSLFSEDFGISIKSVEKGNNLYTGNNSGLFQVDNQRLIIEPNALEIQSIPYFKNNDYRQKEAYSSCISIKKNKGVVCFIPFDLGTSYLEYPHFAMRNYMEEAIEMTGYQSILKISGSNLIHAVIRKKNEITQIHLINTSGKHADPHALGFDEIPSLHKLDIEFLCDAKPKNIILQPGNIVLDFNYEESRCSFKLENLEIYNIIEIK